MQKGIKTRLSHVFSENRGFLCPFNHVAAIPQSAPVIGTSPYRQQARSLTSSKSVTQMRAQQLCGKCSNVHEDAGCCRMNAGQMNSGLAGLPLIPTAQWKALSNCVTAKSTRIPMQGSVKPVPLGMVREITSQYKGLLLDQFGVLHDGAEPYPGAIDAVASIAEAGVRIMLLSNSSRRAAGATARLEKMGFNPNWFAGVITSGEVTHTRLASRPGAFWQGLGRKCIHISWASRGGISLDGLGLSLTDQPEDAEFILAHGTQGITLPGRLASGEDCSLRLMQLEELKAVLDACARQTQPPPMIVANPDIVTVSGVDLVTMPGTLGKHYAQAGGTVHLMGKPVGIIYADALQQLGLEASQVVAVGDSLEHDVVGAQEQGIDTLFICGGIHAKELPELPQVAAADTEPDSDRAFAHLPALLRLCADYGLAEPPTFVMQQLR